MALRNINGPDKSPIYDRRSKGSTLTKSATTEDLPAESGSAEWQSAFNARTAPYTSNQSVLDLCERMKGMRDVSKDATAVTRLDVLRHLLVSEDITDVEFRMVAALLLAFHIHETGECNPTQRALGAAIGKSERSIGEIIKSLECKGMLDTAVYNDKRTAKGLPRRRTQFAINIDNVMATRVAVQDRFKWLRRGGWSDSEPARITTPRSATNTQISAPCLTSTNTQVSAASEAPNTQNSAPYSATNTQISAVHIPDRTSTHMEQPDRTQAGAVAPLPHPAEISPSSASNTPVVEEEPVHLSAPLVPQSSFQPVGSSQLEKGIESWRKALRGMKPEQRIKAARLAGEKLGRLVDPNDDDDLVRALARVDMICASE